MNTEPSNTSELRHDELLRCYFERRLTDEQGKELLDLWENSPRLRLEAVRSYRMQHLFDFLAASETRPFEVEPEGVPGLPDTDVLSQLAALSPSLPKPPSPGEPAEKPAGETVKKRSAFNRAESRSFLPLPLVLPLVLVVFAVMVYHEFRSVFEGPRALDPFGACPARVGELVDATFDEGAPTLKKGQLLDAGPLAIQAGTLEIEYQNGVRVVLEGPARFHVETTLESACDLGRLSVYVPPEGKGFSVMTPRMTVRDLGTAFYLDVGADRTELHVVEGEVEAHWLTRDWFPFKAGRGVEIDLAEKARQFVAEPEKFVSEAKVGQRKAEYVARRRAVWDEQTRRQADDPALIYRLDTDNISALAKTPGSREGRRALQFRQKRDRIAVAPAARCDDMTLLASVRLEQIHDRPNTLVMGDALQSEPGEFHWQVDRYGALQFFLQYGSRQIRLFSSPAVLQPKDCRTWIFPAVVADSARKTITHYLDGRVVAELPWTPVPLLSDRLTLGNEPKVSNRSFKGDIEELWIFSRPFTPKEIEDFYRNNQ